MAQTDQDLQPIIRERTEGEKQAYQQGYIAGIEMMERRLSAIKAAAKISLDLIGRPAGTR